jgi:hypothetical protein
VAIVIVAQQDGFAGPEHYVEPAIVIEVGGDRISLSAADVDDFRRPQNTGGVWFEVINRLVTVMSHDDLAPSVLVEVCQQRITWA